MITYPGRCDDATLWMFFLISYERSVHNFVAAAYFPPVVLLG